jgi:hypothetical protein
MPVVINKSVSLRFYLFNAIIARAIIVTEDNNQMVPNI